MNIFTQTIKTITNVDSKGKMIKSYFLTVSLKSLISSKRNQPFYFIIQFIYL